MTQTTKIHFSETDIILILKEYLLERGCKFKKELTLTDFNVTVRPHARKWDGVVIPADANGDTVGIEVEVEGANVKVPKKALKAGGVN